MNQGKLEVVKQEMTRVNIDILGISELKWTGMGEFNSNDHCIYYFGQESLRRNGVAIIVNKSPKCSTWVQSQNDRMNSVHFQGKPFNITVIQAYAPTSNAEEDEVERFYDDLQDLLVQFSSVAQSCLTLCDHMNRSTPGLAVHHHLPEFTQTQVH